jgi:hypothetical protein
LLAEQNKLKLFLGLLLTREELERQESEVLLEETNLLEEVVGKRQRVSYVSIRIVIKLINKKEEQIYQPMI